MIEVLVTVLILGIGLLGLAVLQARAMKGSVDSGQRSKGVWLTQEIAERIHSNPDAVNTYVTATTGCGQTHLQCSDYFDQASGNKVNATANCSSTDLATFDIWELTCGYTNTTGVKGNLKDYMIAPTIKLTCSASPCTPNSDVTITTSWQGRSTSKSKTSASTTQSMSLTIRP
jgi:type IV pilus assembly protein PilV